MKYTFTLPEYQDTVFELNSSFVKGITDFKMNGKPLEKLTERGKPFSLPKPNGNGISKVYIKPALPDFTPTLYIDKKKHTIAEKLKWYEYAIGALPFLLILGGGFTGAIIGAPVTLTNFQIIRSEENTVLKYIKVIGLTIIAYVVFYFIALQIKTLLNR